ncbi:MAG: hypothetical protein SVW02_03375, partial [Candidatus Nanohaloarchaea archaeon]|nr:hypothetical protein [Candidatus Nanohaloarchaea archaeon]
MPDDVLTFEELRQVQNQERDSDTLQALDESFFDRAQNYLELKQGGDDHLENQEYRNARNIVEDILDMRQKKIVKLAFLAVKSGVTVDNLLPHEESLFEDVKDRISTYRDRRHTAVFDGSGTADASGGDGTGDPARESASPAAEDAAGADEAAGDKVELEEDSGQEDEAVDRGNSEIGEEEQAPGDD